MSNWEPWPDTFYDENFVMTNYLKWFIKYVRVLALTIFKMPVNYLLCLSCSYELL